MKLLIENKAVLEKGIADNTVPNSEKSKYTDASWKAYADALKAAQELLEKDVLLEKEVNKALKSLSDVKEVLERKDGKYPSTSNQKLNQTIRYTKSYKKTYGAKAFSLGAKVTVGKGALKYKSSNKKVAEVSSTGKVTIKGTGICTITITASAAGNYKAKSVNTTIKVVPKKVTLSSVKPVKGKKLTVKWKKAAGADGYQVQYCLKSNFKSGAKITKVKGAKTLSAAIGKLQKGKKYYVRVRAYKNAKQNGKTVMLTGEWSKARVSKKVI